MSAGGITSSCVYSKATPLMHKSKYLSFCCIWFSVADMLAIDMSAYAGFVFPIYIIYYIFDR